MQNTEPAATLVIFLIFAPVALIIGYAISRKNKALIKQTITRLGGENIKITSIWVFGSNKGGSTYNISFTDRLNIEYKTSCTTKVFGNQLFWTKTPVLLIRQRQRAIQEYRLHLFNNPKHTPEQATKHTRQTPVHLSSKEQLLDNLLTENKWLREELERVRHKK